jgi:hypothetical protein
MNNLKNESEKPRVCSDAKNLIKDLREDANS